MPRNYFSGNTYINWIFDTGVGDSNPPCRSDSTLTSIDDMAIDQAPNLHSPIHFSLGQSQKSDGFSHVFILVYQAESKSNL